MREFKFRAWDGKKMHAISALYSGLTPAGKTACRVYNGTTDGICYADVIMQSTGLHDKNGKDIFEGDLIRVEMCECTGHDDEGNEIWIDCEGPVSFEDGAFVFHGHSAGTIPVSAYIENITVIGHIYEDHERQIF